MIDPLPKRLRDTISATGGQAAQAAIHEMNKERAEAATALDLAEAEVARLTAALSAANEACAKVAECHRWAHMGSENENTMIGMFARGNLRASKAIAAAIRSRSTGEA